MRIAIVGAGKGGTSLLEILSEDPPIKITGVADRKKTAPGIRLATALRIPTTADFKTLLKKKNDIIINVTGSPKSRPPCKPQNGMELRSSAAGRRNWPGPSSTSGKRASGKRNGFSPNTSPSTI
ncbi:MAG: hypothetical protein MPW15_15885 [Candidatus Manganitrophus sp.]|nr:hypothetical protein [Candidatus Manganitrophus sp.]